MDLGLQGKTVFVTGASGGIGLAVAEVLAAEGANLVLQGHRQFEALRTWVGEQEWSGRALAVEADVTASESIEAAFERAVERFGPLHGCVVNAGIWPPEDTPLADMTEERLRRTLDVNLAGAVWTSRAFLRSIRQTGPSEVGAGASIVYTGSTAAKFGEKGHSDYSASKAALYGLMRSLKNEIVDIDPYGRVNVVDPGWTVTEMTEKNLDEPGVVERVVRTMAVKQLARAVDIANALVLLLSPTASRHVSGEILTVAGGMEGRVLWEAETVDASAVRERLR
ncbi:3-oxoacyl-[acyl-carrier-protein] reductase FabG [Planctomycetes bacterium Poly30]|uniref:3-oxoacyl-[acyl-carrier-protein] reductase FabG n=1 Tax=Saltatorellus ferox TaxID=2528018 RepID=A0A518EXV9_9BACT|nr:3-oxoacyl-[acyl-carrier-protein] reductase FabG [Planctomycetes bacterium Poly30]